MPQTRLLVMLGAALVAAGVTVLVATRLPLDGESGQTWAMIVAMAAVLVLYLLHRR